MASNNMNYITMAIGQALPMFAAGAAFVDMLSTTLNAPALKRAAAFEALSLAYFPPAGSWGISVWSDHAGRTIALPMLKDYFPDDRDNTEVRGKFIAAFYNWAEHIGLIDYPSVDKHMNNCRLTFYFGGDWTLIPSEYITHPNPYDDYGSRGSGYGLWVQEGLPDAGCMTRGWVGQGYTVWHLATAWMQYLTEGHDGEEGRMASLYQGWPDEYQFGNVTQMVERYTFGLNRQNWLDNSWFWLFGQNETKDQKKKNIAAVVIVAASFILILLAFAGYKST